jgi:hypothetical protein
LNPGGVAAGIRWDFALVYSLSRAWLIGADPYELEGVSRAWHSSDGPPLADPSLNRTQGILVYPPTTLVVVSPLAALPWSVASLLWLGLNVAGMGLGVWIAARLAGLRGDALWAALAAGVWLAPFGTNMKVGQTAVVALGLVALGEWARLEAAERDERPGSERFAWLSGICLGLGTALKPQMGLLFIAYEAGRLRWRPVLSATIVIGLAVAIGAWRLQASVPGWLDAWRTNIHNFTTIEDADPTRGNPTMRHHMVNLHYLLHNFTDNRELVRWAVYAIVGTMSLAYFVVDLRRGREKGEGLGALVSISMTAVVSLLVVYHRFYDAVLLVFPAALAVRLIAGGAQRALGVALLAACSLFFVPGAVALATVAAKGWVPASVSQGWLWQDFLLPHEVWALLAMALLLIAIRASVPRRSA